MIDDNPKAIALLHQIQVLLLQSIVALKDFHDNYHNYPKPEKIDKPEKTDKPINRKMLTDIREQLLPVQTQQNFNPSKAPSSINHSIIGHQKDDNQLNKSLIKDKKTVKSPEKMQKKKETTESSNIQKPAPPRPTIFNRPKPPCSAYLRFSQAMMQTIRKQKPHLTQTDIIAVTGHMWNNLTDSQKLPYQEEEKRAKEKYEAARIEFERLHPQLKLKKKKPVKPIKK